MTRWLVLAAAALVAAGAAAQHQPYAGLQQREIKALSAEEIADLRAGRGMGFALAAELNGYPGPMHVLELAERLRLSAGQRQRIEELFRAMRAETIPLGERLIALEAALDREFAARTVTPARLAEAVAAIGAAQASLRAAHLRYHLDTVEVLSPEQIGRYNEARGYGGAGPGHGHRHRH